MDKFSRRMPPRIAARRFRGQGGNYRMHACARAVYHGRVSTGGDRIGAHLRNYPDGTWCAVQFRPDTTNDKCRRADIEIEEYARDKRRGVPLINKVPPDRPRDCPPKRGPGRR